MFYDEEDMMSLELKCSQYFATGRDDILNYYYNNDEDNILFDETQGPLKSRVLRWLYEKATTEDEGSYGGSAYGKEDSYGGYDSSSYEKKESKEVLIDYSVLSVGVMTLGLIMVVEVARHKIDHMAHHKPFYEAVLHGVYSELATLGIVEFLLHVLTEYYKDYDKARKTVFADVHFLLFYTAVLNAIGSILLYMATTKVSEKLWIKTETLELNHYVEIREEFDRVKKQLEQVRIRNSKDGSNNTSTDSNNNGSTDDSADDQEIGQNRHHRRQSSMIHDDDEAAEEAFRLDNDGITSAMLALSDRIRYPALKSKYNQLLVQVRFHELRVHFLQAYNLPTKLKISDYLIRSEQAVLLKLIHVKMMAWLLLTGVVNLFYYILGVVSYKVEDSTIVGTAMIWIFFWIILLFVFLSWLVSNKMKSVFKAIMHSETLWDVHNNNSSQRDELEHEQTSLFWGGDPKIVVAAIQSMQFGYALALSTIVVYWKDMSEGNVHVGFYVLAIVLSYAIFTRVTAHSLPRYTLCTSLGQLVNEQRLLETVADFKLEEAKTREVEAHALKAIGVIEEEDDDSSVASAAPTITSTKSKNSLGAASSISGSLHNKKTTEPSELFIELVKTDTKGLRTRMKQMSDGVKRTKQMSDGVTDMASTSYLTTDDISISAGSNNTRRSRTNRRKAQSEGVALMANLGTGSMPAERNDIHTSRMNTTSRQNSDHPEDELSVASDASGHSDVDDIPNAEEHNKVDDEHSHSKEKETLSHQMHEYYTSSRYVVISNVFGTMGAFFFVGQRVESFLHSEGIASEKFTHFDFAHDYIFWLLVAWLCMFVINSMSAICFIGSGGEEGKQKKFFVAAIVDVILCSVCLILFLVAETKRCCDEDGLDAVVDDYDKGAPCSCNTFGARQYGGLGKIEPYTSLIALRVFRFWFAKRIINFFKSKDADRLQREQSMRMDPFSVFSRKGKNSDGHEHDSHGHGHGHGHEVSGTAAELWRKTIASHPEIAEKHGEFSEEILRAMLGILPPHDHHSSEDSVAEKQKPIRQRRKKEAKRVPASPKKEQPGAIIPAKKRSEKTEAIIPSKKRSPSTIPNDEVLVDSLLTYPLFRLIRSMRRCDRRLLPIIPTWAVVDVVMTRFELVYFHVTGDDKTSSDVTTEASKRAVVATKGGKDLRLCDVAASRQIAGHLLFSEIISVHVVRRLPRDPSTTLPECPAKEVAQTEFWRPHSNVQRNGATRGQQWIGVVEDRLNIETVHGNTLSFRFYSDLDDSLSNTNNANALDEHFIHKNNALQWAQSIGRLTGPNQLKQPLPNFGSDTSDELRDYLTVVEPAADKGRPGMLQRMKSTVYEEFEV